MVQLVRDRLPWFRRSNHKRITRSLPFFERDGHGYVHVIRSGSMIYDDDGNLRHTALHFWCGGHGFMHPDGKPRRNQKPYRVLASLSAGRTVCATCMGRAIGAGQLPAANVKRPPAKFQPREAGDDAR